MVLCSVDECVMCEMNNIIVPMIIKEKAKHTVARQNVNKLCRNMVITHSTHV